MNLNDEILARLHDALRTDGWSSQTDGYKSLSPADKGLYDRAIGAAREGTQFGRGGAFEVVFRFAVDFKHYQNQGVRMAIQDAETQAGISPVQGPEIDKDWLEDLARKGLEKARKNLERFRTRESNGLNEQ